MGEMRDVSIQAASSNSVSPESVENKSVASESAKHTNNAVRPKPHTKLKVIAKLTGRIRSFDICKSQQQSRFWKNRVRVAPSV